MSVDAFISQFSGLTEEYLFYNGDVSLVYEPKNHVYYLRTEDGELEAQDGVTTVCHIIDKSEALIPWACKQMACSIFANAPIITLKDGSRVLGHMTAEEFESLILKAKTAHKDRLEEAGDIGHIAHAWIENYIKSILAKDENEKLRLLANFPYDERARNCCFAALDWMANHNVRWLGTERKIYSRNYKYAGTMDGLCLVDACHDLRCCPSVFKDRLTISDWKTSNYLYMEYLLQTAAYMQAYNEESGYESGYTTPIVTDRWIIRLGKEDAQFDPWHAGADTFVDDFDGFLLALNLKRRVASIKFRIKLREDIAKATLKAEKKAAKEAAEAAEKERKAQAKLEAQQARAEALRLTCKGYATYQGKRKPTCNDGKGCLSCSAKYSEVQAAKPEKPVGKTRKKKAVKCDGEHGGAECGGAYQCWKADLPPWDSYVIDLFAPVPLRLAAESVPQFTIGQWADYICLNYTGLITHTPETCNCGESEEVQPVPVYFDKSLGARYINSPVCERCHAVRTKSLQCLTK